MPTAEPGTFSIWSRSIQDVSFFFASFRLFSKSLKWAGLLLTLFFDSINLLKDFPGTWDLPPFGGGGGQVSFIIIIIIIII